LERLGARAIEADRAQVLTEVARRTYKLPTAQNEGDSE
jgi:hypothetical protein